MTHWRDYAACAWADREVFYPSSPGQGTGDAKRICGQCAVVDECLDYAMRNAEGFGVWGGLSTPERYRLAKITGHPLPVQRSYNAEEVLAPELGEVIAE